MLFSPAPNPVFPTTLNLKGLSSGNRIGEMPTGYSKGHESRKPGPSWVCRTVVNKKDELTLKENGRSRHLLSVCG